MIFLSILIIKELQTEYCETKLLYVLAMPYHKETRIQNNRIIVTEYQLLMNLVNLLGKFKGHTR